MGDLPRRPVGFGQIRKPVQPSVAHGGFEDLPEDNDFLMHGVSGGRFSILLNRLFMAMHPVILKLAGGDFRKVFVLHEGKNVIVEPPAVGGDIDRAALALGADGILP